MSQSQTLLIANDPRLDAGTHLPVMEAFYTLQGEGVYAGQAAYFIRIGGCDVGCVWCDVKDSWDAHAHPIIEVEAIAAEAAQNPARLAVITGGEPAIYNLQPLLDALRQHGFRCHIETSGAYPIQGDLDWVTLSPKKFKPPVTEALARVHEYKVVVYHKSDLDWMLSYVEQLPAAAIKTVQPEWSKADSITPMLVDFVKAHPEWRMSLQTHKYMNIP